jgi:uncharacterized protein with von Willebrand factor type A (vWA) domain
MTVPSPTVPVASEIVELMVGFARTLRYAGVPATQDRVHAMVAALAQLDVLAVNDAYWAGRLTLCGDPEDLERYDAAFALYFSAATASNRRVNPRPAIARVATIDIDSVRGDGADEAPIELPALAAEASRHEVLRHKDVAELSSSERAELQRLFALLAPRASGRRTRRHRPARSGSVDLPRSVRRMLHAGGEPTPLARRRRRSRPRRLVLLVDVSGSMASYADAFLRFGHAAVRSAPPGTEVFTLGTRLTRVTRELRVRDPDRALAGAGRAVPDWSGGTRLGDTLKAFSDLWGQRGVARGAVVVLCSDGWERGDPAALGAELARLSRLSHALIWVNPHKGKDGFAPITGGMVAALPHLDALVAGHSFAALEELVQVIAHA